MKRLLGFLLALSPYFCYAQFDLRSSLLSLNSSLDDAKWIGSNQYVLYSDYLPQFRISWTVQLDKASDKLAVLLAATTRD